MWSAPIVVAAPVEEPFTVADVKQFLRIESDDTTFDAELAIALASALAEIEALSSTRMITQDVELQADSFADLALLPIGPVSEIVAIGYVDTSGAAQTIDIADVELFGAGLRSGIRPVFGTSWPTPAAQHGAIAVTLRVGYGAAGSDLPGSVQAAILRRVRADFDGKAFDLEAALINDRIWL